MDVASYPQVARPAIPGGKSPEWEGMVMGTEEDRVFHLERAEQCRRMAEESTDPTVRKLHEELAAFHEAEAQRDMSIYPVEDAL